MTLRILQSHSFISFLFTIYYLKKQIFLYLLYKNIMSVRVKSGELMNLLFNFI